MLLLRMAKCFRVLLSIFCNRSKKRKKKEKKGFMGKTRTCRNPNFQPATEDENTFFDVTGTCHQFETKAMM